MSVNKRVLFLDIDGVVNKQENFNPTSKSSEFPLDAYCAFLVGRIQIATDCDVVLSSSWRNLPDGVEQVEKYVVNLVGKTPNLFYNHNPPIHARGREWNTSIRGDEVNSWLSEHPEVERYAILDDDADFYDDQPLFLTSFEEGLTEEIAQKVIDHLLGDKVEG